MHDVLACAQLTVPQADATYRRGVVRAAPGRLSEALEVFGKRMALLRDARPLFVSENCYRLQREIIDWYGAGLLACSSASGWTDLVNDLVRYVHAYALWRQFKFARTGDDS